MTDANVAVTFSASTSDFESGIAAAREALASLAAPIADLNGKYAALGAALAESHTRALQAMQSGDNAAYADSLRAAQEAISGQIKAEQDGLKDKLAAYADDARNHRLSAKQEKLQASRDAIEQTYAPSSICSSASASSPRLRLPQRQRIDNQIAQLERNEQRNSRSSRARRSTSRRRAIGSSATRSPAPSTRSCADLLAGTESWRDAVPQDARATC